MMRLLKKSSFILGDDLQSIWNSEIFVDGNGDRNSFFIHGDSVMGQKGKWYAPTFSEISHYSEDLLLSVGCVCIDLRFSSCLKFHMIISDFTSFEISHTVFNLVGKLNEPTIFAVECGFFMCLCWVFFHVDFHVLSCWNFTWKIYLQFLMNKFLWNLICIYVCILDKCNIWVFLVPIYGIPCTHVII